MWEDFLHRLGDYVLVLRGRMALKGWPGQRAWERLRRAPAHLMEMRGNWRSRLGSGLHTHSHLFAILALVGVIIFGGFRAVHAVRADAPVIAPIKVVNVYYFDLGSGKLYAAPSNSPVPMPAPSGQPGPNGTGGGVRAYVYACNSCADPNDRYIGFLESADPGVPAAGGPSNPTAGLIAPGHYIANPVPPYDWYEATGTDAQAIIHTAHVKCGWVKTPMICAP